MTDAKGTDAKGTDETTATQETWRHYQELQDSCALLRRELSVQVERADREREAADAACKKLGEVRHGLITGPEFEMLWCSDDGRVASVPKERHRRSWIRSYAAHALSGRKRARAEYTAQTAAQIAIKTWEAVEKAIDELEKSEQSSEA